MSTPQINWRLGLALLFAVLLHAGFIFLPAFFIKEQMRTKNAFRVSLSASKTSQQRESGAAPNKNSTRKKAPSAPHKTCTHCAKSLSSSEGEVTLGEEISGAEGTQTTETARSAQPAHIVKPEFTERARLNEVEGEVVLQVVVGADGRVNDVSIAKGLGYGLDERAVLAMRQSTFKPARDNHGTAIIGQVIHRYKFQVEEP